MLNQTALLIPVFLLFAVVEWLIVKKTKQGTHNQGNSLMNICLGAIDQFCALAYFVLFYLFLEFIYHHFRIFTLPDTWVQWLAAYIAIDFISYWYHRGSHRINLLWAGHVTHHSSSFFNFTNGFRTSPFQGINRIPFWAVLPLLGFSPVVLVLVFKLSGVYDFFQHTQAVPKIKWLEKWLVTPSLHRVHHGKNEIYIDKNYGSTFIIWDKIFGTYQEETEPVIYGIKDPDYKDNDPVNAIFFQYKNLWKGIIKAPSFKNKLKVLFMPPGWKQDNALPKQKERKAKVNNLSGLLVPYCYYKFVVNSCFFIAWLMFKEFLPWYVFGFAILLLLSDMVYVVRIIHGYLPKPEVKKETIKNYLIGFVFILIYIKTHLLITLLYCLVLIGAIALLNRENANEAGLEISDT